MNETITKIKEALNNRRTIEAKKLIDGLDIELGKLDNLQKFFDEIKTLIRNLGKTNMINTSEIKEAINNYENKNKTTKG